MRKANEVKKFLTFGLFGILLLANGASAAGPATKVVITSQPTSAISGIPFNPPLIVQIQDASGALVSSPLVDITINSFTDSSCQTSTTSIPNAPDAPPFQLAAADLAPDGSLTIPGLPGGFNFAGIAYRRSGTIYLGASSPGLTSDCSTAVVVSPTEAGTINVSPASKTLSIGQTQQITTTVFDINTDQIANPTLTWTSSNNNIATVDNNGLVSAIAAGSATITANSDNASTTVAITVTGLINFPPVIINPSPIQATVNQPLSVVFHATDANNDQVIFSLGQNSPSGAALDPISGNFTWTPTVAGTYLFDLVASDGQLTVTDAITIVVSDSSTGNGKTITPTITNNESSKHNDDRCGTITCEKYREYKGKYKNDANRKIYLQLRELQRTNPLEFKRLEGIYMTNKKLSKNELSKLSPKLQNDFKTFKKYNGYKHYRHLKEKI